MINLKLEVQTLLPKIKKILNVDHLQVVSTLQGNTNNVYLIYAAQKYWVMRKLNLAYSGKRQREHANRHQAHQLNIAAAAIYEDEQIDIMPFILSCPYEKIILTSEGLQIINFRKHAPKKTLVAQDLVFFNQVMQDHQIAYLHQMHSIDISILLRQNYLVAIANLLKKLHGSDANFITQTNVFLRNKKLYANFANALADIYDEYLQEQITREQFADIEFFLQCNDKSLKIHEQLALKPQPCHMDPSHKNFLIDSQDKVYLSDWEFASMGDPMFDLANFATSSYLDADQEQHFLQTYFGANYKRNPAYYRYLVQKPTVVLWKLLWYLEQVYLDNKYIADAELKYRIAIRIQEANTFYLSEAFNYALEQLKKN